MIFRQLAVGAAALTLLSGAATAATFEGSTSGFFRGFQHFAADPNDTNGDARPSGSGCFGSGCTSVSWGRTADDAGNTIQGPDGIVRSIMSFQQTDFSVELTGGPKTVEVARIDWFNAEWSNFDDLFQLDATFNINLTAPFALSPEVSDDFAFGVGTTGNDSSSDADTAKIAGFNGFLLDTPLILNDRYRLTGFSFSVIGDGSVDGNVWSTQENASSSLIVSANISAVPLPAAGWLLIAGVGGLAAMKRRRKNTA
ncbi:VPLPA-CTERM sorting domain-containing protein [Roseobacter sp. S98]|uniref:VPLPA-CTERM sorting domain-containing protein n=1 Tax=Roseobacter algicola (ex Choi et al. 2025) (nom. illeg.) TaxID=3092138 RepID=UPI0035C6F821